MARQLTEFRLDEISGVDNPAQKKAKMLIAKRDFDALYDRHMAPLREAIAKVTGKPIQKQEQEKPIMSDVKINKAEVDARVVELMGNGRKPNVSKRMAEHMAAGEAIAKAGAYDATFLAPSNCGVDIELAKRDQSLRKARGDWAAKVAEIKSRDNCTITKAMEKAAIEHPDLHRAYCSVV